MRNLKLNLPINYNSISWRERRRAREWYVKVQNGKCHHCGSLLSGEPDEQIREMKIDSSLFPEHFFKYPIHLHHDHSTGMTIGAVHNACNAVLWQYYSE